MQLTGRFRICGVGVTETVFTDLGAARSALQSAKDEHLASGRYLFNVHARTRTDTGYIGEFCDWSLDTAPIADYYATFNHTTGKYEDRATYIEAQNKTAQLLEAWSEFLSSIATIEAEWIDEASGALTWVIYETLHDPKT